MEERYKLYNGDCLEIMDKLIEEGVKVDCVLTDPPYGTTQCKWDTIIPFDDLWEQYNRIIKDNGAIVLFGSEPFSTKLRYSNLKSYKYDWVQNKKLAGNEKKKKKQPLKIHENIMVFNTTTYFPQMTKGKMRKKMTGGIKESEITGGNTVVKEYMNDEYYPQSIQEFSIANLRKGRLHPTQKPVELLEYLIKTYSQEGEVILDNCMGSGSTGVAALNLHRKFIGMELDENYFNIAENRIKNIA